MSATHVIFDWGDTLMRDFPEKPGPMADWDVIEVIPGVSKTLEILAQKYILVVATNAGASNTELMKKALNRGCIEHYFSHYFSSKDLGFKKPDVRFFREICHQIQVHESNCVFVGNDYKKDIEGAYAAGMKTIFFNYAQEKSEFCAAHSIVHHFEELLQII